jgi:hypothetical protein
MVEIRNELVICVEKVASVRESKDPPALSDSIALHLIVNPDNVTVLYTS